MKDKPLDPRRLDMRSFARDGAELAGTCTLRDLARLAQSCEPALADVELAPVPWRARGETRHAEGARAQTWLHLQANASVRLQCQRCLLPMTTELSAQRSFLFAPDEAEAARLDEDMEDDVLVLSRSLDLIELVEDELILALPLVPRHDNCPVPLSAPAPELDAQTPRPNPFAALADLRRTPGASG
jgi:uncharacterized protein